MVDHGALYSSLLTSFIFIHSQLVVTLFSSSRSASPSPPLLGTIFASLRCSREFSREQSDGTVAVNMLSPPCRTFLRAFPFFLLLPQICICRNEHQNVIH